MNINEFEIEFNTPSTVAESKISLKKLLDCGEFSAKDYQDQKDELDRFDDNLMCAWASRVDWNGRFLDNAGIVYYEAETGNVVEFVGYC
ncbi:hypothetical protein [Clostridium beijerinckii]|uniref:Uncharacterized protein n=1 Tax=Clostridium beijerinckii TaxID=1520 RepID=A0AAE5H171_CLOBE|nr:hypothetical protein [Clostridium beijerinckii]NSB12106.1 hypothetical protein [Clostridium beijerinckii]OOM27440.1 hypothetical protein CLOBE_29980 [Clostridium beijerinckii]